MVKELLEASITETALSFADLTVTFPALVVMTKLEPLTDALFIAVSNLIVSTVA